MNEQNTREQHGLFVGVWRGHCRRGSGVDESSGDPNKTNSMTLQVLVPRQRTVLLRSSIAIFRTFFISPAKNHHKGDVFPAERCTDDYTIDPMEVNMVQRSHAT